MEIRSTRLNPVQTTDSTRQKAENIANSARFMDVLAMMQSDGVIAKNAALPIDTLGEEQKEALREMFDIADIRGMSGRREVLNELVGLGAISAEDSELSLMQLLPPGGGVALGGSWEAGAGFEEMLSNPNYLDHLKRARDFDGMWGRTGDAPVARAKVYDLLKEIYL